MLRTSDDQPPPHEPCKVLHFSSSSTIFLLESSTTPIHALPSPILSDQTPRNLTSPHLTSLSTTRIIKNQHPTPLITSHSTVPSNHPPTSASQLTSPDCIALMPIQANVNCLHRHTYIQYTKGSKLRRSEGPFGAADARGWGMRTRAVGEPALGRCSFGCSADGGRVMDVRSLLVFRVEEASTGWSRG